MRQKETESVRVYKEMEKRRREYAKTLQKRNPLPQARTPADTPTTATVRRKETQAMSTGQNGRQQSVAVREAHPADTTLKANSQDLCLDSKKHSKISACTARSSGAQSSVAMKPAGKATGLKKDSVQESSGKASALREGAAAKRSGKSTASKQNGLDMGSLSESKHKAMPPEKKTGTTGQPIAFSHLMELATVNAEPKQDSKVKHKPLTESSAMSARANTLSREKDKPAVQTKKQDLGESVGASESGPSKKRALGKSTGALQSSSSSVKHHVTPTFKAPQSKEKTKMYSGREPSSKEHSSAVSAGAHQPKHHPTMKSLSFYHVKPDGSGGRPSSRPGHQRVSGSWLDQLGYSMAELQRKRKQQELEEFEDDDMYDDDDGFVVDDEVAEDVDVSATIKELFGYDRKK